MLNPILASDIESYLAQVKPQVALIELEKSFVAVLVLALDVCDPDERETMFNHLRNFIEMIAHLAEHSRSKDRKSSAKFLRSAKSILSQLDLVLTKWLKLYEKRQENEAYVAKSAYLLQSKLIHGFKPIPWYGHASNRAKGLTEDALIDAEKKGTNVNCRFQKLPRGSIAIVELWRKDVSRVVESILQVFQNVLQVANFRAYWMLG